MSTRDFSWCKGGRCVRLTTYHPRSAERQENLGPQPTRNPLGHLVLSQEAFTFYITLQQMVEQVFPCESATCPLSTFNEISIVNLPLTITRLFSTLLFKYGEVLWLALRYCAFFWKLFTNLTSEDKQRTHGSVTVRGQLLNFCYFDAYLLLICVTS